MHSDDTRRLHSTSLDGPPRDELGADFWCAFRTLVGRLAGDNYFCEDFPDECPDGIPIYMNDRLVATAMKEELGQAEWPIPEDRPPSTPVISDIIEFFFRHASKATKTWYHAHCDGEHPEEYDRAKGRYEYTVRVNSLFGRLGYPYELRKGRVKRAGSRAQDGYAWSGEFPTEDPHLQRLLSQAMALYYDRSGAHKREGLCCMVDAFERVKSVLIPSNKKRSIEQLVAAMSPDGGVAQYYDTLLGTLTDIGNSHAIRHHEVGKAELADESLVDFLFHVYLAVVRFALQCIDRARSQ